MDTQTVEPTILASFVVGDYEVTDMAEARVRLSALLGRPDPVSEAALRAAVDDPIYAMHLMASRSSPALISILLENPPRREADPLKQAHPRTQDPSKTTLLRRFARSMADWSRSGFAQATPEVRAARLEACKACPNLRAPESALFRRVGEVIGIDGATCALCGCVVAAKSRIDREMCPGENPERPGFNRWGQDRLAFSEADL